MTTVFFDLDGTLLNTLPDIAGAMNRALTKSGLPTHPERAYAAMTGDGAKVLAQRAVGDRQDMAEQVLNDYVPDYAAHSRIDTAPYPGIVAMLDKLRDAGFQLCVFSNKDDGDVRQVIAHYFPGFPFSALRGRLADGITKPNPAGVLEMAAALGANPADCFYVGDTVTDMRCAGNAGMIKIAVSWGFQPEENLQAQNPVFMAHSPAELAEYLLKQAGIC